MRQPVDRIDLIRNDAFAQVQRDQMWRELKECARIIAKRIFCWHRFEGTRQRNVKRCFKCGMTRPRFRLW